MLIDGQNVDFAGGRRFALYSGATGANIDTVPQADPENLHAATGLIVRRADLMAITNYSMLAKRGNGL